MTECIDCGALFEVLGRASEPETPSACRDDAYRADWLRRRDVWRCNSCGYDAAIEACEPGAAVGRAQRAGVGR